MLRDQPTFSVSPSGTGFQLEMTQRCQTCCHGGECDPFACDPDRAENARGNARSVDRNDVDGETMNRVLRHAGIPPI